MKVAVIGATGFVGINLCRSLVEDHEVAGISRNPPRGDFIDQPNFTWRSCDLHNLRELEAALQGSDIAIYLIHSMLPNLRLNQGSFQDFDLSLADNFGRAARKSGIDRVIYLSGLIPETERLSHHLSSRLEVENVLRQYIPRLTVLRAGIIAGFGGSSFTIVYHLVKRLPVMLCPAWTKQGASIIVLEDVIGSIVHCINHSETEKQTYDIGSPEPITYLEIMKQTANELGLTRYFFTVPWFTLGLSRLWVSLVSGAPKNLVYPLIQSLVHPMVVKEERLLRIENKNYRSYSDALPEITSKMQQQSKDSPHAFKVKGSSARKQKSVRSIQRLPLPPGRSIAWLSTRYCTWLGRYLHPIIKTIQVNDELIFQLRILPIVLLRMQLGPSRSSDDRRLFYITGGALTSKLNIRGRLDFRCIPGSRTALVAIHDFIPALPWYIYSITQAPVHSWIMKRFSAHLARISKPVEKSSGIKDSPRVEDWSKTAN